MKKAIYSAPIVDQIKDLQRACEMALDIIDTLPTKGITVDEMRRSGLREGEFALCDWIVRPRFPESEQGCCGGKTYPITFQDWWNSLYPSPRLDNRIISCGKFGEINMEITHDLAKAVWASIGLSVDA